MLDVERVGFRLGVPFGSGAGRGLGALGEGVGRFGGGSADDDLVEHHGGGVRAVVVEVEVDVVPIFAHEAAAELAQREVELLARVVLQRDDSRGGGLAVEVGVGRIGHQLVVEAVDVEVARGDFGVLLIEVLHLLRLSAPARGVGGLLHLHGNGLGEVVVDVDGHGDGSVAAGALEVAVVVHPLSVAAVERVFLLVEAVVEVAPCGVLLLVVAGVDVVDDDDLRLPHYFLARGNVQGSVDDLLEHIQPGVLEAGEGAPVAAGVAVDGGVVEVLEILCPDEFRTVPDGTSIDACLLHDGSDSGCHGIFLSVVFAEDGAEGSVPSAVVVAHAVVLGQS